ncbi:M13-type metalloendopeptidase [Lactobacillus terrae]|uniref:M13-type metalloendopeptidase n=1 Tax=Lactobacillus terrae TaxID=2269374 RepID=UPI0014728C92|nr:M13 family metallopeptidase [Lactobacillus terrae]
MKHKGSIFICGTALAIILGLSVEIQTVNADTVIQDPKVEVVSNDNNVAVSDDQTTTDQDTTSQVTSDDQYAGGDWSVDSSTATPQENFYYNVNGQWLSSAQIPEGQASTGAMDEIQDNIDKEMMSSLENMANGNQKVTSSQIQQAVDFYKLATTGNKDTDKNYSDINADLQKVAALNNYDDLNNALLELSNDNISLPFNYSLEANYNNSNQVVLNFSPAANILPDSSYYDPDNDDGIIMLSRYSESATNLLKLLGYSSDEAATMVDQAMDFDRQIYSNLIINNMENVDDTTDVKPYNYVSNSDFVDNFTNLKVGDFLNSLFTNKSNVIDVSDTSYYNKFNNLVSLKNFDNLKSWMIVTTAMSEGSYLGEDALQAVAPFEEKVSGLDELPSMQKLAYDWTGDQFKQVLTQYYGKNYFGEAARTDATKLIDNILYVYKDRLQNNTWLSDATKKNAITKLNNIKLKVAYPDDVDDIYSKVEISQDESLYNVIKDLNKASQESMISDYNRAFDKSKWTMPSFQVNAQYDPQNNDVTIPAAILQSPFYSSSQSSSSNYGAIGAVIGHEITHAFDNSGAMFDANGNYNNWWTEEDQSKFQDLVDDMANEYDGIPYADGTVDGYQTVGENIADNGGLNVAFAAAQKESDFSAKEFFESWEKAWRYKTTNDHANILLTVDPHAPAPIRGNVAVQNFDDFYKTFDIKPGDAMWLDEADRVNIW